MAPRPRHRGRNARGPRGTARTGGLHARGCARAIGHANVSLREDRRTPMPLSEEEAVVPFDKGKERAARVSGIDHLTSLPQGCRRYSRFDGTEIYGGGSPTSRTRRRRMCLRSLAPSALPGGGAVEAFRMQTVSISIWMPSVRSSSCPPTHAPPASRHAADSAMFRFLETCLSGGSMVRAQTAVSR